MGRQYAGVMGLVAFATILFRGVVHADAIEPTLKLACLCLFAFALLGGTIGWIADQTVFHAVATRFNEELRAARSADNARGQETSRVGTD